MRGTMDIPPQYRREICQPFFDFIQLRCMGRTTRDLIEHVHYVSTFLENGGEVCFPGRFANPLYSVAILFFNGSQLRVRNEAVVYQPFAHLADTVKLFFPLQSFSGFISFVRTARAVTLR